MENALPAGDAATDSFKPVVPAITSGRDDLQMRLHACLEAAVQLEVTTLTVFMVLEVEYAIRFQGASALSGIQKIGFRTLWAVTLLNIAQGMIH